MIDTQFRKLASPHSVQCLLRLYRRAIEGLDSGLYTHDQQRSWLRWADNPKRAGAMLQCGITILAVTDGDLAGFAQLHPKQRINMLYVDPKWSRMGIGSRLIRVMEQLAQRQGTPELGTRASHASLPMFIAAGFVNEGVEKVTAPSGVCLEGIALRKKLPVHTPVVADRSRPISPQ